MTIDITMGINDTNCDIINRPICSKCKDNTHVVIDKIKVDDSEQTVVFWCGACNNELGSFKCDVWTSYIQVPQLIFKVRVNGKKVNKPS